MAAGTVLGICGAGELEEALGYAARKRVQGVL